MFGTHRRFQQKLLKIGATLRSNPDNAREIVEVPRSMIYGLDVSMHPPRRNNVPLGLEDIAAFVEQATGGVILSTRSTNRKRWGSGDDPYDPPIYTSVTFVLGAKPISDPSMTKKIRPGGIGLIRR